MAAKLPKEWWDVVLDGGTYRLDLTTTGHATLSQLRTACYQQAERRLTNVVTHKQGPMTVLVAAWGTGGRAANAPILANAAAQEAPTLDAATTAAPPPARECDCGRGPGTTQHPLTCAFWGAKRMLYPVTPATPPPVTDEDEDDLLLGPCSCGHGPRCLPTCSRFD